MQFWHLLRKGVVRNAETAFVTTLLVKITSKLKLKKYPFCLDKTYKLLNSIVPVVVKNAEMAFLKRPIFCQNVIRNAVSALSTKIFCIDNDGKIVRNAVSAHLTTMFTKNYQTQNSI